jgi:hypothetical protein
MSSIKDPYGDKRTAGPGDHFVDNFRRDLEYQSIKAQVDRMEDGTFDAPITNTSKMAAAEHLLDEINNGRGGIERSEAAGQAEMVKAGGSRLPADGTVGFGHGDSFDWSKLGIKIGEPIKGDEIWVEAELPEGWKLEGTDHAMHSNLLDDKGRQRASIFYKAAFYDRSCSISPSRRYSANNMPEAGYEAPRGDNDPYVFIVKDGGKEIYRSESFHGAPKPEGWNYGDTPYSAYDLSGDAAKAYIEEHYPDYLDATAYWDDE